MIRNKLSDARIRIACIVLAFILVFSSAQILLAKLGSYATLAFAETADESAQATPSFNDMTSGSNELYLPNYDTEVITKTKIKTPKVETFGKHDVSYYPSFTNQITDFDDAKKSEILAENQKMIADVKEWFAKGTLKNNLKKHVSADGQFSNAAGNYDKAKRIEKIVTVNSKIAARKRSLGTFAVGGEVITVTIDESLVNAGLTVNIGYPYNGECDISSAVNTWKNDRMAQFFLSFKLTETVTYIGSPLGGMITLDGVNSNLGNFDIKISGAIDMPDYKLGVSTKEDWQNILAAPGPYVWLLTPYQYFVMPKTEIADIEDPYNAMLWWHKASMISMYSMAREDTNHFYTPVISVFDSYVYVGEGVAKVWAFVTNAPKYWCHGIVDYENLMLNGAWGAIHEYNHHHQSHVYASTEWGVGGITEVTNNVINALSYILLTDVATTRSETKILNGWGAVTDPYCNYKRLSDASKGATDHDNLNANKLFGYVDLMHGFGAGRFVEFLRAMYGYGKVDGYDGKNLNESKYLTTQDGFTLFASLFYKTDFTDYFTKVWRFQLSQSTIDEIKSHKFDEYVSINNLYSAGVKGIETGRAYTVKAGENNVLNFDKYTLCSADGFTLERVSEPKHGKLTKNGDGTYSYAPDGDFTQDSFELTYKVTLNGKTYVKTLVVKLAAEGANGLNVYPAYVDFRNRYLNHWYSESVSHPYVPVEIKCLDNDGNDVKTVKDADPNTMFDGDQSTGFHTAWQGKMTPYPHNYYFTFAQEAFFNRIKFTFQAGYYAIGEYEIYTSNDGTDYELLIAGNNTTQTNFNVQLENFVTAKYVKLVVKSNSSNQPFTNVKEIEFTQGLEMGEDYNVYSSKDDALNYERKAKWTGVSGNYLNSQAEHAKKGKVKFYLTGTDLMLYSTNKQCKIKIDGQTYVIEENTTNYTPSFVIAGLEDKRHLVEIDARDMNLDMIKTTGTVSRAKGPFVNWAAMGVSIGAGSGFLGTLTAFLVIVIKQRKLAMA